MGPVLREPSQLPCIACKLRLSTKTASGRIPVPRSPLLGLLCCVLWKLTPLTPQTGVQILHDIIIELYSTESRLGAQKRRAFIAETQQKLKDMWDSVPDHMKFKTEAPSPPPWIFMLQYVSNAPNNAMLAVQVSIFFFQNLGCCTMRATYFFTA